MYQAEAQKIENYGKKLWKDRGIGKSKKKYNKVETIKERQTLNGVVCWKFHNVNDKFKPTVASQIGTMKYIFFLIQAEANVFDCVLFCSISLSPCECCA